jgi:hypothetical protein
MLVRKSPLLRLRRFLTACAWDPDNDLNNASLSKYYAMSERYLFSRKAYYCGFERSRRGPYVLLWLDPFTFDCLCFNVRTRKPAWKKFFGLFV